MRYCEVSLLKFVKVDQSAPPVTILYNSWNPAWYIWFSKNLLLVALLFYLFAFVIPKITESHQSVQNDPLIVLYHHVIIYISGVFGLQYLTHSGRRFSSVSEYMSLKTPEVAKKCSCLSPNCSRAKQQHSGISLYTIKMNEAQDPMSCDNISVALRFVDESSNIKERLLTITTAAMGDANFHTDTFSELREAGLNRDKALCQVYDKAFSHVGKLGGSKTPSGRADENPFFTVLRTNHTISCERVFKDLFSICSALSSSHEYCGSSLNGLLEQH